MLIYEHLFTQPNGEILGLSREPAHNYDNGPPSNWIADSRQQGLVYESDAERPTPTNSRFLRTSRLINEEATPVFYGTNKVTLYAEDNNDIFYWLLDIGAQNRLWIHHLEISWAYGVEIESGRSNIRGIIERIAELRNSPEEEIQGHRDQLIKTVKKLEDKTIRLIIRTLNLLVSNQELISLALYLPGVDGGDIWDMPNDNFYFAEEIFSNSTSNIHACIPEAIKKMVGIQRLTIGYTKDFEMAEEIAKVAGIKDLIIRVRPEGNSLGLSQEERTQWLMSGWKIEGAVASKTLKRVSKAVEGDFNHTGDDYESGRLKSSMLV